MQGAAVMDWNDTALTDPVPTRSLEAVIDDFARCRVLVIGDLMLDRFIYGDVSRISPEAPVPVINATTSEELLGGAGNVARNVVSLGARCALVAVVGEDEVAAALRRALDGVETLDARLVVRPAGVTTVKTRFVATLHSTHLLRADREDRTPVSAEIEERLIACAEELIDDVDVVILSDYDKGVLTPRVLRTAISLARQRRKIVVVDPKGTDYERYAGADVLTPNVPELGLAIGRAIANDEGSITAASRQLIERTGCRAILVTRAEHGVSIVGGAGEVASVRPTARAVVDVSGAGDTVVAGFALALTCKAGLVNAARIANAAAGLVVAKRGTARVSADDMREVFLQRPRFDALSKLARGEADVASLARAWQRQGLVVGFTNGCFDLLHPGHIALLEGARVLCDRLIVGLNTDESVRRLKGEARPIQHDTARALLLASLSTVDSVVMFADDTPLALIIAILPDVLIKGGDYTREQVIGHDVVERAGGRVALIDLVPGASTSRLVEVIGTRGAAAETVDAAG